MQVEKKILCHFFGTLSFPIHMQRRQILTVCLSVSNLVLQVGSDTNRTFLLNELTLRYSGAARGGRGEASPPPMGRRPKIM